MSEFKLPTETVKLPSKGLIYPKENPLSAGEIEMKYMTAKEEDILTNSNYIQAGTVFDKLFQSMIVTKINYADLLLCDKEAIMLAARILGYGKNYPIKYRNPIIGEDEEFNVDLSQLKEKQVDYSLFRNQNEFYFKLPNTGNEITFKLLTHADERAIESELNSLKKIKGSKEVTVRLKHQIIAVNGSRERKDIVEFVENGLLAVDSVELRRYIKSITPGVDFTFTFNGSEGYVEEGVQLPIDLSFFYPRT